MNSVTKQRLVMLVTGLLFGTGLSISGMVLPEKVIGFFDFAGKWDPSLAFVMMGAIAVHFPVVRFIQKRPLSVLGLKFQLPTRKDIDWRLVVGALIFGIGWGIGGICPGPGIVDLVTLSPGVLAFVAAMIVGMLAEHKFEQAITAGQKA